METTAHIDFIASAYTAAVITVAGLIAWVTLDYRAQTRKIAELEMQGIIRRAAAPVGRPMQQAAAPDEEQAKA